MAINIKHIYTENSQLPNANTVKIKNIERPRKREWKEQKQ